MSQLPLPPDFGAPLPPAASPQTLALLATRRSSSAATLRDPAPEGTALDDLLRLAVRVPDHGKMTPWRFVILRGDAKAAFTGRLRDLAARQTNPTKAMASLGKLEAPPLAIAVISAPRTGGKPIAEQRSSADAVCTTMLIAAAAMGFGANWITDWYGEDPDALTLLGVRLDAPTPERLAGWILLGTPSEPPLERVRPDVQALTTEWRP